MRISRTVQWIRETARLPAVGWRREARGSGADRHLPGHRRLLAAGRSPDASRTRAWLERQLSAAERVALHFPPDSRRGHPHACVDGRACGPPRRAPTAAAARERLLLGGAAAAFPDVDFVGFLVDPLRFLAYWHQGPTHSLVLLPLWAVLLGAAYCGVTRRWQAFGEAAAVSGLGLASHIVLDVITVYGTQVLYPFSDRRVSLGTTFVIDPLFTAVIAVSLVASLRSGAAPYRGDRLAAARCLCRRAGAAAIASAGAWQARRRATRPSSPDRSMPFRSRSRLSTGSWWQRRARATGSLT